ncbi:nucleotide-diphospho-sugar transferase family protein [Salix suchowensis]|nr:nucleotide-diphospho-sugar transferase family protein [Salix suchowensis]
MLSESTVPRAVLVCASISVSILLLYGASGSPSFLSSGYSFNFLPFLLGGSSDSEFSPIDRILQVLVFFRETYPGYNEQDVLNFIKFDPLVERLGLKMRFLDTAFFGGLCEPSKDLNLVCTMHANCCFGLDNKLHDLRIMLQDWKTFLSLPPTLKRSLSMSWRVPQTCSLNSVHQYDSPEKSDQQTLHR